MQNWKGTLDDEMGMMRELDTGVLPASRVYGASVVGGYTSGSGARRGCRS